MSPDRKNQNNGSPTTVDIARACGLDQSTVSRALRNDLSRVSVATRDRILAVAQEMGYDPNRFQEARRLVSRRHGNKVISNTIGLIFFHQDFCRTNYFIQVMQGIYDASARGPFGVYSSDTAYIRTSGAPVIYRRGEVDGVLMLEMEDRSREIIDKLRAEPEYGNRPIVGLVEHIEGCSAVYADHFHSGYVAMSHLLDLGHRHTIVFIGGERGETNMHILRVKGCAMACIERGIDPDTHIIRADYWGGPHEHDKEQLLLADLAAHPEVTALIVRNDLEAAAIHSTLTTAGLRVPQDISLVSSDDTDAIIDRHGQNILTTVRLPLQEIGSEATRLLTRRIMGEEREDRDIVLPTELIVRKSTAPPSIKKRV